LKIICKEKANLSAIIQLLLVKNTELRKLVIKLLSRHFISHSTLLREVGVVDLLMHCIDENTGMEALQLLFKIQENIEGFNNDIEINKIVQIDKEIVLNDAKIKNSVFLRFLPVCFVRYLVNDVNVKDALGVFLSEEFNEPTLIWSKQERTIFARALRQHLGKHKERLRETDPQDVGTLSLYEEYYKNIIAYPRIEKELRCGNYFLKAWIKANGPLSDKCQDQFYIHLINTLKLIVSNYIITNSKEILNELIVTLKAFDMFLDKYLLY